MVLGSFQCRCVKVLRNMVWQGPAVLAAGAGQMGCFFISFSSHLSYLPFLIAYVSLWRRLDILKYSGLGRYYLTVVVSYCLRRAC